MISERELALLRNPEALASLRAGIAEAERGEVVRYPEGHWARLEAELDAELGPDDD